MVEWDKFFQKADEPAKAVESLKQMGWDDTVPGYESIDLTALTKSVESKSTTAQSVLMPAVMSAKMQENERETFITSTVYGKKQQQKVAALSSTQAPSTVDREHLRSWARDLNRNGLVIADWDNRERAFGSDTSNVIKKAQQEGLLSTPPASSLTGKDILAAHPDKKPGVWVGELLKKAEQAEDRGVFYDKSEGLQWLKKELS